jgi:hypothetical protein
LTSLLEIPSQLAMLLSLAAASVGAEPTAVPARSISAPDAAVIVEPLQGPYRFTERSWLRALHENPHEADRLLGSRIFVTSGGRFYVPRPTDHRRVVEARNDVALAARLARAAADRNAARLRQALGRLPAAGDLYIAHVFGAETTIALLRTVGEAPDAAMKSRFPSLSATFPEPVTVGEFYRQVSSALREPPRLVAIGLQPLAGDALLNDAISGQPRPGTAAAWQTTVDLAATDSALQ